MERIKVQDTLKNNIYFGGKVNDIIAMLVQFNDDYSQIPLEIEEYSSYGDTCFRLIGTRYETDEEYADRIQEQRIIDSREESEARQLYEKLKQLFDPI